MRARGRRARGGKSTGDGGAERLSELRDTARVDTWLSSERFNPRPRVGMQDPQPSWGFRVAGVAAVVKEQHGIAAGAECQAEVQAIKQSTAFRLKTRTPARRAPVRRPPRQERGRQPRAIIGA